MPHWLLYKLCKMHKLYQVCLSSLLLTSRTLYITLLIEHSSLHWCFSYFLCRFCSNGVFSDHTSSFLLRHQFGSKRKNILQWSKNDIKSKKIANGDYYRAVVGSHCTNSIQVCKAQCKTQISIQNHALLLLQWTLQAKWIDTFLTPFYSNFIPYRSPTG